MPPILDVWAPPSAGPPWLTPAAARAAPSVGARPTPEWNHVFNVSWDLKEYGMLHMYSDDEEPDYDDAYSEAEDVPAGGTDGRDNIAVELAESTCVNADEIAEWDVAYDGYYDRATGEPLCPECDDVASDCDCDDYPSSS